MLIVSSFSLGGQPLFFDDFEQAISDDSSFEHWTQENLEGWHYWHIIPGGGPDGSQCMRFENNDLRNHDWLISKAISCEGADSILIGFDYFHSAGESKPRLWMSTAYSPPASGTSWQEVEYEMDPEQGVWHHTDMVVECPGEVLFLAFEYKADPQEAMFILLDNFQVMIHETIVYERVGESTHFEFYTSWPDSSSYWTALIPALEKQYLKLSGVWNRPGIEDVFKEDQRVKIYYTERDNISQALDASPAWKCGYLDAREATLYLSPLLSPLQNEYYESFEGLAINAFSQMAIMRKYLREGGEDFLPYFLEGFGLYESGFRPRRDSILRYMELYPELDYDMVRDTTGISTTFKKDLIACNIEGQLLTGWAYLGVNPGAYTYQIFQWPAHLEYFYALDEENRIKLQRSTTWFNFYCATSDTFRLKEVEGWFRDAREFYIENYEFDPRHPFNVVIYTNPEMGARHMVYNDYNGGSGCGGDKVDEISPNYNFNSSAYYSKYFGYAGLVAHEFFHVFQNHFMWDFPGGFWAEGSADFSQCHSLGWELPRHSFWNIEDLFGAYADRHPGEEINLAHIAENPHLELDIYFLGHAFFEFLFENYGGYIPIREFFNRGMDYSVFGASYEEIDQGYIAYLKRLLTLDTEGEHIGQPGPKAWLQRDVLNLRGASGEIRDLEITIFNLAGQEMLSRVQKNWTGGAICFPMPELETGNIYILGIKDGGQLTGMKIINSY